MLFRWSCPDCGVRSRLLHRYLSPVPVSETDRRDVGACHVGAQMLLRFDGSQKEKPCGQT